MQLQNVLQWTKISANIQSVNYYGIHMKSVQKKKEKKKGKKKTENK